MQYPDIDSARNAAKIAHSEWWTLYKQDPNSADTKAANARSAAIRAEVIEQFADPIQRILIVRNVFHEAYSAVLDMKPVGIVRAASGHIARVIRASNTVHGLNRWEATNTCKDGK